MPETVLTPPAHAAPLAFTRAQLEWLPWLEPLVAEMVAPALGRGSDAAPVPCVA